MVWFLVQLAQADGEINEKEWQQLDQAFGIIGYNPADKETEKISLKVAGYSLDNLMNVLNTLNRSNKEWFAITTYSLIMCDGVATDEEINQHLYVITKMGISEDEFCNILKKEMAFQNKFK
jgi:uncharacterized membrane protein YebE (DUF533 family)